MKSRMSVLLLAALTALSASAELHTIPNSQKYRDSSLPHAHGSDGSASIEARALIGRDRVTTLEVTTGALDTTAPAPGNIDKLQLKIGDVTTNYNNLAGGGTFALQLTGLARGNTLQVQTNVSGIDPSRTNVITVDETVKRRPDIEVVSVDAPFAVAAGAPATIVATLAEINGDVGARTNCVMRRNSTVLDTASNVWVDAGGMVTCVFHVAFDEPGSYALEVQATDVAPADWATFNNFAFGRMLVTPDTEWSSNVSQQTTATRFVTTASDDPEHPDINERTQIDDRINFSAVIPVGFNLNNLSVQYREYTDGQRIRDEFIGVELPSGKCKANSERSLLMGVCTDGARTIVNAVRTGATTKFLSRGWFRFWVGDHYEYDQYVEDDQFTFGTPFRYGATVDLRITMNDGEHTWTANPFFTMQPWENPAETSTTCRTRFDGVEICTETYKKVSGKSDSKTSED